MASVAFSGCHGPACGGILVLVLPVCEAVWPWTIWGMCRNQGNGFRGRDCVVDDGCGLLLDAVGAGRSR